MKPIINFLYNWFGPSEKVRKQRRRKAEVQALVPTMLDKLRTGYPNLSEQDYTYWAHKQARSELAGRGWIRLKYATRLDGRTFLTVDPILTPEQIKREERRIKYYKPRRYFETSFELLGGRFDQDWCDDNA